jgi:group I intron endonuclease
MAVYAIVHLASGRLYIGATTHLVRRWGSHRWKLGNGSHENPVLQAAWTREGATAFEFRVLETVSDPTQLPVREQAWLDGSHSAEPAQGFNIHPQAESPRGRKQRPEVIARMAERQRGRPHSAATRARISASAMGNQRGVATLRRYTAQARALSDTQVAAIKQALAAGDYVAAIARRAGIATYAVEHIARGDTYRHVLPELDAALRQRADGRKRRRGS